jgi:hypothetical protein
MEKLTLEQFKLLRYIQADLQSASTKIDKFLDRKKETDYYHSDLVDGQKMCDGLIKGISYIIAQSK